MDWNLKRYCKLQDKRSKNKLDKDEQKELEQMAMLRLFHIIEADPDVKAVFDKLKSR